MGEIRWTEKASSNLQAVFDYIAKDGVPTYIRAAFPDIYITRLRKLMRGLDEYSFVFIDRDKGGPIQDIQFRDAFKRYCGREFYPHIVRSYYATVKAKEFLILRYLF